MQRQQNAEEIRATLVRLDALVEESHFGDESERTALRQQLADLHREIDELNDQDLPTSLHEALQRTEGLAVNRLVDSSNNDEDSNLGEFSWDELGRSIEQAVQGWEAEHPKLAVALMNFAEVLSKLGI